MRIRYFTSLCVVVIVSSSSQRNGARNMHINSSPDNYSHDDEALHDVVETKAEFIASVRDKVPASFQATNSEAQEIDADLWY